MLFQKLIKTEQTIEKFKGSANTFEYLDKLQSKLQSCSFIRS